MRAQGGHGYSVLRSPIAVNRRLSPPSIRRSAAALRRIIVTTGGIEQLDVDVGRYRHLADNPSWRENSG